LGQQLVLQLQGVGDPVKLALQRVVYLHDLFFQSFHQLE
jgi:hypothetical protein